MIMGLRIKKKVMIEENCGWIISKLECLIYVNIYCKVWFMRGLRKFRKKLSSR